MKVFHNNIINLRLIKVNGYAKINLGIFEKNNFSCKKGRKMLFLAYIFTIIKNVIYGTSVIFTGTLTDSVDVLDILALRFLLSCVVLWLLKNFRVIKINVGVRDIFRKTEKTPFIKSLILAAIFEPVLYMFFETLGISMVSGVTAGVILSLGPVSSVIVESLILKEKSTLLQKLFLALGILGVVYISICTGTSDGGDSFIGMIFVICAVLSGSLFGAFSRKSSRHFSSFEVTYFACIFGAAVFNAINIVRHLINGDILSYFDPYFDVQNMIGFVFLAIISTIVAASMGNFALARMQLTTTAAFGGLSTITTIVIGVVFNSEPLYYFHYIGISLIIIRMIGVSAIAIKREKSGEKIPTPHIKRALHR